MLLRGRRWRAESVEVKSVATVLKPTRCDNQWSSVRSWRDGTIGLEVSAALAKAVAVVQMVRLVRDVVLRFVIGDAMRDKSNAIRIRRVHSRR
jgi:hypothetical protein